jgi:hypothetical protein
MLHHFSCFFEASGVSVVVTGDTVDSVSEVMSDSLLSEGCGRVLGGEAARAASSGFAPKNVVNFLN